MTPGAAELRIEFQIVIDTLRDTTYSGAFPGKFGTYTIVVHSFIASESMSVHEIESRALRLPRHERARLAHHLIASLEEEDEVDRDAYGCFFG